MRRRRESQESLAPNMKFPRIDQESATALSMIDSIGIKDGKFECKQPLDTPKSNRKFVTIVADLSQSLLFDNSKTEAKGSPSLLSEVYNPTSKGKPVERSKLLRAKREEERQRIERANQKRITEWAQQSSKRRYDLN